MFNWIRGLIDNYKQNTLQDKWKEVIAKEKAVWGETFYYIFSQGYHGAKAGVEFKGAWRRVEKVLGIKYEPKEDSNGKRKNR